MGPFGPTGATGAPMMPSMGFTIFFPMPGGGPVKPDPEKIKRVLQGLPGVSEGLMRRVDRVVAADDSAEEGWEVRDMSDGEG